MTGQELTKFFQDLEAMKSTSVTTSLERIKLLRNALSEHGRELGLNLSGVRTGLSNPDSSLETVVEEYNKIVKQLTPSEIPFVDTGSIPKLVVDSNTMVQVPSGYYAQDFFVTGAVSAELATELAKLKADIKAMATPAADVVAGAKAVEIITNEDGTLTLKQVDGEAGTAEKPLQIDGIDTDTKTLVVVTQGGKDLATNIPTFTDKVVEAKITVIPNATVGDEDLSIIEATDLEQGYYDRVKVLPVLETGTSNNKIVNVRDNVEINIIHAGNTDIVPGEGFDYIKGGVVKVEEGSASVATKINGNQIILTPSHTDGWLSENPDITGSNVTPNADGSYTLTLPTIEGDGNAIVTIDSDNNVLVTPGEGCYNGNDSIPLMFEVDGNETQIVSNPNTSINTDPEFDEEEGKYIVNVVEGKTPTLFAGPLDVKLDKSNTSIEYSLPESPEGPVSISETITATGSEFYIVASKGYTEGDIKRIEVEAGGSIEFTTEKDTQGFDKIVVKLDKSGWVEEQSTDVTDKFLGYADALVDDTANGDADGDGILDESKGTLNEVEVVAGQALFTYGDNLDEAANGVQEKTPAEGKRYFTSAKVDLSALIREMDII